MLGLGGDRRDQKCPRVERWAFGWGPTVRGAVGLAAGVLKLAAAFFLGFLAAGLVAAVDLGLDFLGPAFFLVTGTLGCVGASVTG